MTIAGSHESASGGGSKSDWEHVPPTLQYLRIWASKFGLRGLTFHFEHERAPDTLASREELAEVAAAYEAIAKRGDAPAITAWCLSSQARTVANEAKEQIRGLLLLFERLADRGLAPFTDGQVRFICPDPRPFDWSVLPPHLRQYEPWLKKFGELRTEDDLYRYVEHASEIQLHELAALKKLLEYHGQPLLEWCEANNTKDNPAKHEAFQAEWLFLLADSAKARIDAAEERKGTF